MGYNAYGAAMLAFTIDSTFIYMASLLYDIPYDNVQSRHCSLTEVNNLRPLGISGPPPVGPLGYP